MPPKAKFTRKEIINAALNIIRRNGIDSLTARALGSELESSPRPIFTVFQNMEEVQSEAVQAARDEYNAYIKRALSIDSPEEHRFKNVGKQYILFALNEPKLFQLLFMREKKGMPDIAGILPVIDDNYVEILESIKKEYGISDSLSNKLYGHLWIYTHGIASLCATKTCHFTGEQIGEMITEVCLSLLKRWREEAINDQNP